MTTVDLPIYSTCTPWATFADLCEPCNNLTDTALVDDCLQAASDILYQLSGRQFAGICQDTVRPQPRQTVTDHGRPIRPWLPAGYGYSAGGYSGWDLGGFGMGACNRSETSVCTSVPEVSLGGYPLTSIVGVKIDGVTVDPATYAVSNNRTLIRTTSTVGVNDGWPCCNDPTLADTEKGTWSVTFTYGMPPPRLGALAAAELACQLLLVLSPSTLSGGGACLLPTRTVSVVRQGITALINDPLVFLDKGRTGMPTADLFLESVNPAGVRRRATVMTPDIGRRVRRVG